MEYTVLGNNIRESDELREIETPKLVRIYGLHLTLNSAKKTRILSCTLI